jgi:murein DD-endopeptidase MepM/ murein hydrolase activator NlpD
MGRMVALALVLAPAACTPGPHVLPLTEPREPAAPVAVVTASAPEPTAVASATPIAPLPARFGWVLPLDHGVRGDRAGRGWFLAPRYHGKHNGVDLLAPIGTAVLAPCSGKAVVGKNSSHGKWAHVVCPLPAELGATRTYYVSFFFAHLSRVAFDDADTHDVSLGDTVGAVGKSGNAAGASVAPHLHLEAAVQDSELAALAERHSGRDNSDTDGSREVAPLLASRCLEPNELARDDEIWRNRRVDPFVLLTCLGADRPGYQKPKGSLAESSHRWSEQYRARFDVDSGEGTSGRTAAR